MSTFNNRIRCFVTGTLLTLAAAGPALADDSEIYASQASSTGAKPNVLFIMDTSGSMDSEVQQTVPAYDKKKTYTGTCDSNYIYWSKDDNNPPKCSDTTRRVLKTAFKCADASTNLATGGVGLYPGIGVSLKKAAQYHTAAKKWEDTGWNDSSYVDCQDDDGDHGLANNDGKPYVINGTSSAPWADYNTRKKLANPYSGLSGVFRFFSSNYMNYTETLSDPVALTRLQIVRDVATSLASSLQDVNLGLMRYSTDAEGGYVLTPIGDIKKNRATIIGQLDAFDPEDGSGGTPLSETLYEAALYLTGGSVDYGAKSQPGKSTDTTAVLNGKYVSPIEYSCQKNYIVYLTDGAPTADDDANSKIATFLNKGSCDADKSPPFQDAGYTEGSGVCMDDLAKWLSDPKTDLNTNVDEPQNALLYMIGFGNSVAASVPYLNMVASAGGTGSAYTAADVPTLTAALQQIFTNIQEDSATFVTPSISVNAFNRAQTDQDLYFSLFKSSNSTHWPGNLKKYKLASIKSGSDTIDTIVGLNDVKAVSSTGFFAKDVTSFWSPTQDGAEIEDGGAASNQVVPSKRVIYTQLGALKLPGDGKNLLDTSNTSLNDKVVGIGSGTTCSDACKAAINWLRGVDINDHNKDGKKDDQYKFMGDPLHGKPAVVPYGKLGDGTTDTTIYVPTNDGLLHAINAKDGTEMWAFMPPELLGNLGKLSTTTSVTTRTYGLDGDVRVLRMDKNQDGSVDTKDDRVWLFFGMRMGGNHYYALDVTDRANPTVLWNIGPNELPQVGQTWSAPVVARVNVDKGNADAEKFVLIFGGGYDPIQESQPYSADSVGNRIYMVDAKTGALLWFAGGTGNSGSGTKPDLKLNDPDSATDPKKAVKTMNNSIPARVTVIDTDGDEFADRLYVGDMGGRIWRVDLTNGKERGELATGGVIAALGNGGVDSPPVANNRRFYNSADVSLTQVRGMDPFYNVAIGSGYRGHPLDDDTQERFYSVRDKKPFAKLSQDQYDKATPLNNDNLIDVTTATNTVAKTDAGWRLDMYAAGKWAGEKVLAESVTANNTVLFTSFEPSILGSKKGACYPSTTNRAYAVSILSGRAALDFDDDGTLEDSDRYTELNQAGIVGDIQIAVKRSPSDGGGDPSTICLAGMQVLKKCVAVGGTVRTFWNRKDAK